MLYVVASRAPPCSQRYAFTMKSSSLQVGKFTFNWGSRTYLMGILNVTPDSFSGDGIISKGAATKIAVGQAKEYIAFDMPVLHLAAESRRPALLPRTALA